MKNSPVSEAIRAAQTKDSRISPITMALKGQGIPRRVTRTIITATAARNNRQAQTAEGYIRGLRQRATADRNTCQ